MEIERLRYNWWNRPDPHPIIPDDTVIDKTEQSYIPTRVQIRRFREAGIRLRVWKQQYDGSDLDMLFRTNPVTGLIEEEKLENSAVVEESAPEEEEVAESVSAVDEGATG